MQSFQLHDLDIILYIALVTVLLVLIIYLCLTNSDVTFVPLQFPSCKDKGNSFVVKILLAKIYAEPLQ